MQLAAVGGGGEDVVDEHIGVDAGERQAVLGGAVARVAWNVDVARGAKLRQNRFQAGVDQTRVQVASETATHKYRRHSKDGL